MKAMIFAAGLGTRLRPLTDTRPKALINVAGKTMLERTILKLKSAGFNDITINIHHLGDQIIDFIKNKHSFDINIHISDERDNLLDTGGGILKARAFLEGDEPILIHNVDILSDIDLRALYQYHIDRHAEATLAISHRTTSRYLFFNQNNRLCGWMNKTTGAVMPTDFNFQSAEYHPMAFGGIHIFSPSLFKRMEQNGWDKKFSIIPFYLSICREANISGWPTEGSVWFDIGKPDTLAQAEAYLLREDVTLL